MKDACCTDNIKHAEDETTTKKKEKQIQIEFFDSSFFPLNKKEFG